MSASPEEMANKIWELWRKSRHEGCTLPLLPLIAQAIREAEDAAIERAIACVSDNFVNGEGHYAIEAIRALKHNKG